MNTQCNCFEQRLKDNESLTLGQGHGGDNFKMAWENELLDDGSVILNIKYSFQNPGKRRTHRQANMVSRYCPFCGIDKRPGEPNGR